jgi:hypothetical protein
MLLRHLRLDRSRSPSTDQRRHSSKFAIDRNDRGFQFFTPLLITVLGMRLGFGATLSLGAIFSVLGASMVWLLPETRGTSITALD